MKKGVVGFALLTLFILMFLSLGVFATPPEPGTCTIVTPSECVAADGNYRLMGLSAATNAHAQVPYSDYPYVLCCAFGTGNTTCATTPPFNKALGLSSTTNAHAEAPEQSTYLNKVCYEDLQCKYSMSNCGTGDVADYRLNLTSLSSVTNAHVGTIDEFPTKICCKSAKFLSYCSIKQTGATWNQDEAYEGVNVYLTVTGSGPECDGQTLNIEVLDATKSNATSVSFRGANALSWWTAEWQRAGILGGDKSYRFNATVAGVLSYSRKSMLSSNSLTVKQMSTIDHCSTITSCEEYTDSGECDSDTPCEVADAEGISQGVACDGVKTYCSCSWNSGSGACEFVWSEIQAGDCESGYTLCHDAASGVDYCYPASSCPVGQESPNDGDIACDPGEGCTVAACDGQQDSCVLGAVCSGGMCSGGTAPSSVNCSYGFTLCQISGVNYCYPGSSCPVGQIPPSNSNGKCDAGEGCTSADCKDGDRDSCVAGTYCLSGKCASIQDPVTVIGEDIGGCKITQTVEKDCDEEPTGYKTISWTGTWTLAADPGNPAYQKCIAGGRTSVPCPAQIELPFFTLYGFLIAVVIIAMIYVFLFVRKKLKKKKK
jgi:hypothetical protein